MVDSLTGLQNRRACLLRGQAEFARMHRTGEQLSLMFIDLDNFKTVNDQFGHKAGDRLLRMTAAELRRVLRHSDFAVRLGGDEFATILPGTDGAGGRSLAEIVHICLNRLFEIAGFDVSASVGVATFRAVPAHFEEVLQRGDELMYEIKRAGKDGVLQRDVE
ncbi:GGDEF domain-containing protein [Duganella radicis]|nr:GGDEF domain-containing protein [Duganella radicis]